MKSPISKPVMNKIHKEVKARKVAQKEGTDQPIKKVVTKTVHYGSAAKPAPKKK